LATPDHRCAPVRERKAKIVALSDTRGGVTNPRGIDPISDSLQGTFRDRRGHARRFTHHQ